MDQKLGARRDAFKRARLAAAKNSVEAKKFPRADEKRDAAPYLTSTKLEAGR